MGPGTASLVEQLNHSSSMGFQFRLEAMQRLAELPGYDWCGIYRLEGDTLVLDAYVGAETDHDRIPVGRGVCGTAIAEGRNQVVEDVRQLENYLACSLETRSEIVVLIRRDGKVIGQIDIDGHEVGRFGPLDEAMLEELAAAIAERWE